MAEIQTTEFALVLRSVELVAHWLKNLLQRPLTNQSQGAVFSANQIQMNRIRVFKLFYLFDRLVIARFSCPTQQRT